MNKYYLVIQQLILYDMEISDNKLFKHKHQ